MIFIDLSISRTPPDPYAFSFELIVLCLIWDLRVAIELSYPISLDAPSNDGYLQNQFLVCLELSSHYCTEDPSSI